MTGSHSKKKKEVPPIGWLELIVGVVLLLFGVGLLNDPVVTFRGGVESDISPFNVPAAAVSIGIGLYLLWNSISKTVPDETGEKTCPKCGKVFSSGDTSDGSCPSCDSNPKR